MASSKGMAPTVLLPTVPGMGSSAAARPTKGVSSKASTRVVRVPSSGRRTEPKVRAPKIKVKVPKMPKDAMALTVPRAKRIKNGKAFEFGTKRKPII